MTDDEYQVLQTQLFFLGSIVRTMDLADFITRINRCEAIAPILDPTLWRQGAGNLQHVKDLARSLLMFQEVVRRIVRDDLIDGAEKAAAKGL